jgi:mannose-6-phosphate isomerase-like protein (cupin superfamily)
MKAFAVGLTIVALSIAAVRAQQAASSNPPPAAQLFASSTDVTALIAKAKSEIKPGQPMVGLPILQLAPYRANLEYRVAVGPASIHEKDAEMFYVIEGSGTIVTGGSLNEERRTNPENRSGTGVQGGSSRRVAKGDFVMVPENTAHWFSAIDGTLVLMSLHLPHAAAH